MTDLPLPLTPDGATLPLTQARRLFGQLVRATTANRSRVTITDRGRPAAVLVSLQELADPVPGGPPPHLISVVYVLRLG